MKKDKGEILFMDNEKCPNCKSKDILENQFSPEDKPYVIRTECTCKVCKYCWYEED